MKTKLVKLLFGVLASGTLTGLGQSTTNSQAEAVELLRRTLAEQQANPGRIVRTEAATPPAKPVVLSPAAAARRTELERQYLDGKLSARQYQKAIDRLKEEERKRASAEAAKLRPVETVASQPSAKAPATVATPGAKPQVSRATSPKNTSTPIVTPPAGTVSPPPQTTEPTPQQKKIADVEARIDEMLRLKAEREKAALTNAAAVSTNAPSQPLTRRQKLDAILKQNLEGKLSDADYQAQRAKILAEPE